MKEIQLIAVFATLGVSIYNLVILLSIKKVGDTPQEVLDAIAVVKKQAKTIDDLIP